MCALQGRNFTSKSHGCSKQKTKTREVMYYIRKTSLSLSPPLSVNVFFFFQNFDFFLSSALVHLSNMPTSFCDKVPVLKDKTECEGPSTFPEGL